MSRYFSVRLETKQLLKTVLEHLCVLLPILDNDKHYWVGSDEVEKLLRRGSDWLAGHPERELIAYRHLRRDRHLTNVALQHLRDESVPASDTDEEVPDTPQRITLNEQRLTTVFEMLKSTGARSVADLGCGEGTLLTKLIKDGQFERILGMDVSYRVLEIATRRLRVDNMAPRQHERITLCQGSLLYRDARLEGFDAAVLVEVIEHLDLGRLDGLERSIFHYAKPRVVIVTTPNSEYNIRFENMHDTKRHSDHRFEWTRDEFREWTQHIAKTFSYCVTQHEIGDHDEEVGSPTQMAVFQR